MRHTRTDKDRSGHVQPATSEEDGDRLIGTPIGGTEPTEGHDPDRRAGIRRAKAKAAPAAASTTSTTLDTTAHAS